MVNIWGFDDETWDKTGDFVGGYDENSMVIDKNMHKRCICSLLLVEFYYSIFLQGSISR